MRTVDESAVDEGNYGAVVCLFGATIVFRWALVSASGLPKIVSSLPKVVPFVAVVCAVAIYCSVRDMSTMVRIARAIVLMLLAMAYLPESNEAMLHLARHVPYADHALGAADAALGLDWIGYARWVDARPLLWDVLEAAYGTIWCQLLGVTLVLAAGRRPSRAYAFLAAHVLSLTAICLMVAVFPALGAYVHWNAAHAGLAHRDMGLEDHMTQTLEWLRADHWSKAPAQICEGVVSFPSYHAVCCITAAWATWTNKWLRVPSCALSLAMLAGTPIQGAHYFVDIAAGAAIACASIVLAAGLVRSARIEATTTAFARTIRFASLPGALAR